MNQKPLPTYTFTFTFEQADFIAAALHAYVVARGLPVASMAGEVHLAMEKQAADQNAAAQLETKDNVDGA